MYLFFDTETNGLPKNWKAPVSDTANWPRLVQLAWILYNEQGEEVAKKDHIIKPVGFIIPESTTAIHGISTEKALAEGIDLKLVLNEFQEQIEKTKNLVAHNIVFDLNIIGSEFFRIESPNLMDSKNKICTMRTTTKYCAISGPHGYKWPKLSELYQKIFNTDFDNAHNAAADIKATADCFWELKKQGVL